MEWSAHLFSELCKISHVTCGHWFTILFVSQFCFEVFMQVSVLQWISTSPSWYTSMNVCMYVYMNPHVHMHVHSVLCVLIPKMSASVSDSTLKQQCCRGALGAANCQEGPRLQRRECGGQCTRSNEVPKWEVQWPAFVCLRHMRSVVYSGQEAAEPRCYHKAFTIGAVLALCFLIMTLTRRAMQDTQ